MSAASEKRIAIVYALFKDARNSAEAYRKSRELYEAAVKIEPVNHWVMTQFLSIAATPALVADGASLSTRYGRWWLTAYQLAEWQLRSAVALDRVWAHGTLAELELLGAIYGGHAFNAETAQSNIVDHCEEICQLSAQDPFPVFSTRRQFRRYIDHWPRELWNGLAQAALEVLDRAKAVG
jgi:hypothetical protein